MTTGSIVIVSFPYTDLTSAKARPAVPSVLNALQIVLQPDDFNNLKTTSVINVGRIATIEQSKIKAEIGRLSYTQLDSFKAKFKSLVDDTN